MSLHAIGRRRLSGPRYERQAESLMGVVVLKTCQVRAQKAWLVGCVERAPDRFRRRCGNLRAAEVDRWEPEDRSGRAFGNPLKCLLGRLTLVIGRVDFQGVSVESL